MPPRYVALFRGINVGRAKRVPMAKLRESMVALGYTGVATLLNSGNAVFDGPRGTAAGHAQRIHEAIMATLGVDAQVVVVPASRFAAAIAENPMLRVAQDPSRLLLAFTQDAAALAELTALTDSEWGPEAIAVGSQAAYLWCRDGVVRSRLFQAMDRRLGERVTTRNWTTVSKLGEWLGAPVAHLAIPGVARAPAKSRRR